MDNDKNLRRILLNWKTNKKNIGTIYIQYTYKGKQPRWKTGVKCHIDNWDEKKQDIKKGSVSASDKSNKSIVDSKYNQLFKIINDFQHKYGELPSIQHIEENLDRPDELTINVHELFNDFLASIKEEVKAETKAPETYRSYTYTRDCLLETDEYYKYNLNLFNFDYNFNEKFILYCRTRRGQSNKTIGVKIAHLRYFVTWLNLKKIKNSIDRNHLIKPKNQNTENLICLERNELDAIMQYQPKDLQDERTKDIIVFLSHTGIRQIDLFNINKSHIINNCIEFYPQKTKGNKIKAIIPITSPVACILKKYDYELPTYTSKYLTENIVNFCSKIEPLKNDITYIKTIKKEDEKGNIKTIRKPVTEPKYETLTSHAIGRKTFINLCIERKVQLTTIAGMTGHNKIDTIMMHYANKHAGKQTALNEVFPD